MGAVEQGDKLLRASLDTGLKTGSEMALRGKVEELTFPLRLEIRRVRGLPHSRPCGCEQLDDLPGLREKSMRE